MVFLCLGGPKRGGLIPADCGILVAALLFDLPHSDHRGGAYRRLVPSSQEQPQYGRRHDQLGELTA